MYMAITCVGIFEDDWNLKLKYYNMLLLCRIVLQCGQSELRCLTRDA